MVRGEETKYYCATIRKSRGKILAMGPEGVVSNVVKKILKSRMILDMIPRCEKTSARKIELDA